ncbi:MAG: serine protease [Myxococcota bacterium]
MTVSRLATLSLLGLTIATVFAFGPDDAHRELPVPPAVEAGSSGGTLVVDLVDGASEADLAIIEGLVGADLDWVHPLAVDEALAAGRVPSMRHALASLSGHPLVEAAEPEIEMSAYGFPDDPMYDKQWNLRAINAPTAWANTARGAGVVVAVVDTGVTRVEDLEGTEMLTGASFVPGAATAADDQGHGTHVAGTIAQTTNNGIGVAGVAPAAIILPVKVLSAQGFGSSAWIAAGIDYAVDEDADVINLSLGGGYSAVIHNAIKKARAQGVIVVAAAGNSGRRGVGWPGALEETIGVSAVGPDGSLAPYSSYGKGVDIAAPGGDKRVAGGGILQDTVDGRGGHHYVEYQGTSMATPHVAGAAAVLLSEGLPPAAVERLLLDTARGATWNERYGYGTLDLGAALGRTEVNHSMYRFLLGGLVALLVTQLAGTRAGFGLASGGVAALAAGGLFFLTVFPLPEALLLQIAIRPVLEWPGVLLGPGWMHFPLWLSAALPLAVGFTLGAFRPTRAVATGLACGIAAHLFHGAATGTLEPWWLPATAATVWLGANASLAMVVGMGLAGAQRIEERGA